MVKTNPPLFSREAQKRAVLAWAKKACEAWQKVGRAWLQAFGSELDQDGDTSWTLKLQMVLVRIRLYWHRCRAALVKLGVLQMPSLGC